MIPSANLPHLPGAAQYGSSMALSHSAQHGKNPVCCNTNKIKKIKLYDYHIFVDLAQHNNDL